MILDKALIERVLDGEEFAGRTFAEECRKLILGLAHGRHHLSRDAAEEIHQTVMVRLLDRQGKALRAWRGEGKFTTYLTVIVTREIIHGGKVSRRPEENLDEARFQASSHNPVKEAELEERGQILRQALQDLKPRDRLLIALRHEDQLPPREIARILGSSSGAIRKALFDATKRLKNRLIALAPELFGPIGNKSGETSSHSPVEDP